MACSSAPSASAVHRAVTKVPSASRVLEDSVVHNEARRTKKPVVSTCEEARREATEEVASLPPPPIRVAAGSAQVRPPASNPYYRHGSFLRLLGVASRVAAAPNHSLRLSTSIWRQVSTPAGHADADGRPRTPASPASPASLASGTILPRAVLRVRTASRELHDLKAFEHDEVRRVRSKTILLERLSATDDVGSQVRGPAPRLDTNEPP